MRNTINEKIHWLWLTGDNSSFLSDEEKINELEDIARNYPKIKHRGKNNWKKKLYRTFVI